jgi:hypothetical protein
MNQIKKSQELDGKPLKKRLREKMMKMPMMTESIG